MPDPVEDLSFAQQGTDLAKGSSSQLDEGIDFAAAGGVPEFTDTNDDYDDFALEPTWFPERPLTHGVSFGPGANSIVTPPQNEDDVLNDIAQSTMQVGGVPEGNRIWAVRHLAGE